MPVTAFLKCRCATVVGDTTTKSNVTFLKSDPEREEMTFVVTLRVLGEMRAVPVRGDSLCPPHASSGPIVCVSNFTQR